MKSLNEDSSLWMNGDNPNDQDELSEIEACCYLSCCYNYSCGDDYSCTSW